MKRRHASRGNDDPSTVPCVLDHFDLCSWDHRVVHNCPRLLHHNRPRRPFNMFGPFDVRRTEERAPHADHCHVLHEEECYQ